MSILPLRAARFVFALFLATSFFSETFALSVSADEAVKDLSSVAGTSWEFKPEGGAWKAIQVPAGGWRTQGYTCDAGTYRAWIVVPTDLQGRRVRLAFDAINFGADIYAGQDEASLVKVGQHVDGWLPVLADITAVGSAGAKVLVQVDVAGRKKFMVNGKYTVPEGATWHKGLEEGILRGVHLELIQPVRVENVFVRTSIAPDALNAQVTFVNDTDADAEVKLLPTLKSASATTFKYPAIQDVSVSVPKHGSKMVELGQIKWRLGSGSYWWPNVPYHAGYRAQMHILGLDLLVAGRAVQHLEQRFGFRQFQAEGSHYLLNGIHCNLRGDTQQEANFGTDAYGIKKGFGPPTDGNPGWPQAVDNLQRLNFNVMRIHQIPATPYMLDVCDEMGLLIVDESPLRGSERGEDYNAGKDNMLRMDRELVLRDRNHPAIIIWSAANEWTDPIRDALPVIRAVDQTRVVIADGVGDMGPDIINMQHYVDGIPGLPRRGGTPRTDRPWGETEAVWPADNTWQGFAWMGTGTLLRRLRGASDIRNYVLNNAWPNYVSGEGPDSEILESKVKNFGPCDKTMHAALGDPWNHPLIRLMQQCYDPVAACDIAFTNLNAPSNAQGEWPIIKPAISAACHVIRKIAVFNDEFTDEEVTLTWKVLLGDKTGRQLAKGEVNLRIPLGEYVVQDIPVDTPAAPGEITLVLSVLKNGEVRFVQDQTCFKLVLSAP